MAPPPKKRMQQREHTSEEPETEEELDSNQAAMRKKYHELQLRANDQEDEIVDLKNQIAALSESQVGTKRGRSRKAIPETDEEKQIDLAGRRFCVMNIPWILNNSIFDLDVDLDNYDEKDYNNEELKDIALLTEYVNALPASVRGEYRDERVRALFLNGMNSGRSNFVRRVAHDAALQIFGADLAAVISDPALRAGSDLLKEKIGYNHGKEEYNVLYPMLYADQAPDPEPPLTKTQRIFRNPILPKILRSILFGTTSVKSAVKEATGEVNGRIWGVEEVTPGAIAFCATLLRHCLSPDPLFSHVGGTSLIKHLEGFKRYKSYIDASLETVNGQELLRFWNETVFPVTFEAKVSCKENFDEFDLLEQEMQQEVRDTRADEEGSVAHQDEGGVAEASEGDRVDARNAGTEVRMSASVPDRAGAIDNPAPGDPAMDTDTEDMADDGKGLTQREMEDIMSRKVDSDRSWPGNLDGRGLKDWPTEEPGVRIIKGSSTPELKRLKRSAVVQEQDDMAESTGNTGDNSGNGPNVSKRKRVQDNTSTAAKTAVASSAGASGSTSRQGSRHPPSGSTEPTRRATRSRHLDKNQPESQATTKGRGNAASGVAKRRGRGK